MKEDLLVFVCMFNLNYLLDKISVSSVFFTQIVTQMSESASRILNLFHGISSICMKFCENVKNKLQVHNDCGYHKS